MKKARGKILAAVFVACILILAFILGTGGEKDTPPAPAEDTAPAFADTTDAEPPVQQEPENSEEKTENTAAQDQKEPETGKEEEPEKQPEKTPEENSGSSSQKPEENTGTPSRKPEETTPQEPAAEPEKKLTCSLQINCSTILSNMEKLTSGKESLVPSSGVILSVSGVEFSEGETVFDVLKRELQNRGIHMEVSYNPLYDSSYIEAINNLYEFDCGELSGWMYRVNGAFYSVGCSQYVLSQGDQIEWVYTCDLGKDVGGGTAVR